MGKISSVDPILYNAINTDLSGPPASKLSDYRDMRKERKIIKKNFNDAPAYNANTEGITSFLGSDSIGVGRDKRGAMNKMRSAMSVEQTNSNVFDRLLTHSTITSKIKEKPPVGQGDDMYYGSSNYSGSKDRANSLNTEIQNFESDQMEWNCDFSVENAHNGSIYSIATLENHLYSCSKKSLKIWDMDTMDCISDIAAHQGIIKSL